MKMRNIHFIRELLVTDFRGSETPMMQISYDNASYLQPNFTSVPASDQEETRALYLQLGGGRTEGAYGGSTVIIPNRSPWASLWPISADEVRVVANGDTSIVPAQGPGKH